jgi:polar amino acid transport system permease protein
MTRRQRARLTRWSVYALTVAVVAWLVLAIDWGRIQDAFWRWELVKDQFPDIVTQAAKNTLIFAGFGFGIGISLGTVIALMRLSPVRPYRWFAAIYIEVLRGLPALLTILILGFGLPIALSDVRYPNRYMAASLALGLVAAAYIAETMRAGIQAVPKGQIEAARSLGMTPTRTMVTIVMPQALRIIVPPMTNVFVALLKDTALVSVLGVTAGTKELTRFGRDGVIDHANSTPLIVAGLMYLAITIPLTRLAALLERRTAATR